ncbi:MAG: hypothetical protein FJW36_00755 [Acidobacteria bacterium]|nr:hypothetical protein [Acidobacteriota bacterium]
MQIDDHTLQRIWAGQEQLLAENLRLNRKILARLTFEPVRVELHRGAILMALGALPAVVILPWIGNFIYEHWSEWRFVLPAVLLHFYVLFLVALRFRYIHLTLQITYGEPVVEIQQRIAALRKSSFQMLKWVWLTATLIWPPLLVVCLQGFAGIYAYALFGWSWLIWNLLAGLAIIPVVLWILRRLGESKTAGGYFLNRSERLLDEPIEPDQGASV